MAWWEYVLITAYLLGNAAAVVLVFILVHWLHARAEAAIKRWGRS